MAYRDQSFEARYATLGDTEKALWVAGMFEGEGYCGWNQSSGCIQFQITSTDEWTVDVLLGMVGYGHKYLQKRLTVTNKKVYRFSVHKKADVKLFRELIYSYLSPRRQEQIDLAFQKAEDYRSEAHDRHVAAGYAAAQKRWGYEHV